MKPLRTQLAQLAPQIATMGAPLLVHAAEDFTTDIVTYRNPANGQRVKAQYE